MAQSASPNASGTRAALVWTALLIVYFVWGSTYLGIRIAIETMPPFLMAGVRFLIAGAILVAACVAHAPQAVRWPTRREWLDLTLVGGLLLLGGNGLVSWGEQTVPSGIAALLVATMPIWMAVVAWLAFRDRLPPVVAIGVVVGLAGVAILAAPTSSGANLVGPGLVALVVAPLSWAIGSVFASRRESLVAPALLGTGLEMIMGGLLLALVGLATGELALVRPASFESIVALAYLIVAGSLVAYVAYGWLLHHAPLPLVSTYAYVNPIVAVILGALVLREPIEPRTVLAGAVIVVSVAMIISARNRSERDRGDVVEVAGDRATVERAA